MLRVSLANAYIKRTIRPTYAFTQATPKSVFLDPAWNKSVDIYPGMALMKTSGENVTLLGGSTTNNVPIGLSSFYCAPVFGIDEITEQGVNAAAYWHMGPDAEFQVLAPAFDTAVSWTDPGDGTIVKVTAYTAGPKRGQLCPLGTSDGTNLPSTLAIARLLEVNSATEITIGGLQGTV